MQAFLDQFGLTYDDFANPAKEAKGEWVKIKLEATYKPTGKQVTIECWGKYHEATDGLEFVAGNEMRERMALAELAVKEKHMKAVMHSKADHDRHPFQKYMKNTKKRGYSQR